MEGDKGVSDAVEQLGRQKSESVATIGPLFRAVHGYREPFDRDDFAPLPGAVRSE